MIFFGGAFVATCYTMHNHAGSSPAIVRHTTHKLWSSTLQISPTAPADAGMVGAFTYLLLGAIPTGPERATVEDSG